MFVKTLRGVNFFNNSFTSTVSPMINELGVWLNDQQVSGRRKLELLLIHIFKSLNCLSCPTSYWLCPCSIQSMFETRGIAPCWQLERITSLFRPGCNISVLYRICCISKLLKKIVNIFCNFSNWISLFKPHFFISAV